MADQHNAPKSTKRRKLGKNKKKSWRVSKVDDIEEFLDDERHQIRTGGLVAEKPDDVLFVVDTSSAKDTSQLPEPESKRRSKDKPLRCLALLQPDPHSKAVRKPDEPNFQKGTRTNRILDRLKARSQSQARLKAAEDSKKYAENRRTMVESQKRLPVMAENIWTDDVKDNKVYTVKPPKRYRKKPSALPATIVPHPGASANPSYEDHQALLLQAHNVELKKEKEQRKLYNALDAKFPGKADAPNDSTYLTEMSAGLVSDSEEEEEDEANQNTSLSVNPPVRREDRKTKKQRRVEMESKLKEKEKNKIVDVKQRENKVLRIPSIKAEINKRERKQRDRAELKRKRKELEPFKTKRLNSIKFEEQDLALKLSTELVGSYRELKPEGHLLKDIYKSVQRRNIVEPRVKQKVKRKYKPKTFEKKGHKAVTL